VVAPEGFRLYSAAIGGKGAIKLFASAPKPLVLAAIAVIGCAVPLRSIAVATGGDVDLVAVGLLDWITVTFILAGAVAWLRRPESRLGPLMLAGGFASGLSALQLTHVDSLYTVGAVFDILPAALFLHVSLAFPDGRLRSRLERALVAAAYTAAIGLQLVKTSFGAFGTHSLIEVSAQPEVVRVAQHVQLLSLSALCLAGVAVLVTRRGLGGRQRRRSLALLIDSFALGLVMIAVLFTVGTFDGPAFLEIQRATLVVIGISPIVFLLGLLDARLGRSAVGELILELRRDPAPADLRDALAEALRDPSLAFAYWLPDFETYVDSDGRPLELPDEDGRTATLIDRNGGHVGALIHDCALDEEPELLEAVGAAAGMSVENGRLQAELRAQVEELRGSRARVIDAGNSERQRLERNLHDGAQQRLIALSLELSLLEQTLGDQPVARARLDEAGLEIARALEELRAVARGIHPAVLTGHGLEVALESLTARAPLPVSLTVDIEERLPERVEVAAYYVVSESLTNVAKHAHAREASVALTQTPAGLVVEIVDDGVGGADTEDGTGIRGLADRVEALGGRLRVWTPQGNGTRVKAEIPCG
jgi:signal transduction histidine kinase